MTGLPTRLRRATVARARPKDQPGRCFVPGTESRSVKLGDPPQLRMGTAWWRREITHLFGKDLETMVGVHLGLEGNM